MARPMRYPRMICVSQFPRKGTLTKGTKCARDLASAIQAQAEYGVRVALRLPHLCQAQGTFGDFDLSGEFAMPRRWMQWRRWPRGAE
jgi:hypothetical protein